MMALVWLIDLLVMGVKVLGGRMEVNPVLRVALWAAVLSTVGAGIAALGFGLVLLQQYLENLA
ncbi:hypothetical protein [Nocardia huaxiensis]|uniref:Uncharacterized protein n=1 Tax=Nocardia huaxiensis TaxID=2755382 RepID=A0A7D6Z630_9NOCA|nr:hypothetical protein [Nocardia huaxiensis]QLY32404.1 hypothetical protein H0264_09190 [Nocardia huaxiensis]UFS93885.1 hypothetical protein LPY97_24230 [Nocardia huaxiensis]